MAYDQSGLKNIGPIRQKIQARRRQKKAMKTREKAEPGLSARQEKNILVGTAAAAPIIPSIVDAFQGGPDREPTTRGGKIVKNLTKRLFDR